MQNGPDEQTPDQISHSRHSRGTTGIRTYRTYKRMDNWMDVQEDGQLDEQCTTMERNTASCLITKECGGLPVAEPPSSVQTLKLMLLMTMTADTSESFKVSPS